jgi:hypothetical protein
MPRASLRQACRHSFFVRPSGRHVWMSPSRARTPPCQLRCARCCARRTSRERRDSARGRPEARHGR